MVDRSSNGFRNFFFIFCYRSLYDISTVQMYVSTGMKSKIGIANAQTVCHTSSFSFVYTIYVCFLIEVGEFGDFLDIVTQFVNLY